MIHHPLLEKSKTPALVSSAPHVRITNIANDAPCVVPEAAPEAKIEQAASEPVEAEKSKSTPGDVAANADEATEKSPTADGDTKALPAEVDTTPDSSQSAHKTTEETTIPENSGSNEDKPSKEADFPPIDPATGSDALAAEGGGTDLPVSR